MLTYTTDVKHDKENKSETKNKQKTLRDILIYLVLYTFILE